MKTKLFILLSILVSVLAGCSSKKCEHEYDYFVSRDSDWKTYTVGSDFDDTGLEVSKKCKKCGEQEKVNYSLTDDTELALDQESITIVVEGHYIDYEIIVKEKYHIACCGDSLTAGHMWPNQAYPVYLSEDVSEKYEVGNFSYNGLSITGYGGSFNTPDERYILRDEYKKSVAFEPDIFAIMLGTNDATGWDDAKDIFEDEYRVLLDSYIEQFPNAKFIMMVSPPVIDNTFGIPNDKIRDYVNPIQRDLADEYGFEVLDLREEFEAHENFETDYLRPNDGVHFTVSAAQYVANRVWEIAKELTF